MTRSPLQRSTKRMKRTRIKPVSAKQKARLAAWAKVTLARMVRVGNKCERCGERCGRLAGHHRLPKSQGGQDTDDNCVILGKPCHTHVHDNPAESYAAGWMERRT